jgi:uncharacterized protein (DUF58 family)
MRNGGLPRITPIGGAVASAGVAFGALGVVFGYRGLSVAGAAIVLGVIVCAAITLWVPALEVARVVEPTRVARGNPAHGLVSVRNLRGRRSRACSAVEKVGAGSVRVEIPSLGSGRSIAVPYDLPTRRRGPLTVGPLAIHRRDPFGLWETSRSVGESVTLLVEPKVYPLDPRPAGRVRHLDGPTSDSATQGTMTFHSLREYTLGDDIRRVHWRSSARTGTLMVREHVDTSLPSTVIVLDTTAARYHGDSFEDAVDIAASVAAASQARSFPVRMVTTSGATLAVRAGQRGQELRDYLATVDVGDSGGMGRAAAEVLRGRDHDAIVVVAGDIAAADMAEVSAMSRRFATAILVTVRPEGGAIWSSGMHLDGVDAADALTRWQMSSSSRFAGAR